MIFFFFLTHSFFFLSFKYLNSSDLPPSERKYMLLGLNLLRLLSQNRIAEFHTELELIEVNQLHESVYIKHPVEIEQWLMEGSYNKVVSNRQSVPADEFLFFINILISTIRFVFSKTFFIYILISI